MVNASVPLNTRSVLIATPSRDGRVEARYMSAVLQTFDLLRQNGIGHNIHMVLGNSLIADARNRLVQGFMKSNHTDLLFVDDDMVWQPEAVLRLLAWDVPFVGVAARRRKPETSFCIDFGTRIEARGELVTAEHVGTGFLRLRRDCLEAMIQAYPDRHVKDENGETYYCLFDTGIAPNRNYVGEDVFFCSRWKAIGGEVLVDPHIPIEHLGTYAYSGQLSQFLKKA